MKKHIIIYLILFLLPAAKLVSEGEPAIKIHQSPSIASLLQKHIAINKHYPKRDGYRVQIFSISGVNSSDRANLMKAEFLAKYPNAKVYIIYHSPSYKVRIGNFRSKLEALAFIQSIKSDYPFAFAVVDQIEFE